MSGDTGKLQTVIPLTKKSKDGDLYFRRPEVETQLREVSRITPAELFSRLKLPNRDTDGYLYDETLVYLARQSHLHNDGAHLNEIFVAINRRLWVLIRTFRRRFASEEDMFDCGSQVEMKLIEKIFDPESDKGDYAQVNFGSFVVSELKSQLRGYFNLVNREKAFVQLDDKKDYAAAFEPASMELSAAEKHEYAQIIDSLPENIREAAMLIYLDGWQIESKDPEEPTVSRHMGKSSRTIRNWMNEAKEIIDQKFGGER